MREDAEEPALDDELFEPPECEEVSEGDDRSTGVGPVPRPPLGLLRWLSRNGWLILAAAAALVLTRVVKFEPPKQVRLDDATVDLVGEAPAQEFSSQLANPQAVQLRATLRLYPRNDLDVREPDPDLDAKARILSQPVVTTIYAMNATIDQTVRLDGGRLEIDVSLDGTPRLGPAGDKHRAPELDLEQELTVTSREHEWLGDPVERVHLHTRGTLTDLEDRPYRWVFLIEGKLFALDLELHRAV